jgi:uncharacterized membrane protein
MHGGTEFRTETFAQAELPRLRCIRERILQTLCYEAVGLLIITPLYAIVAHAKASESLVLLAVVSAVCMLWAAIHNTVFDWLEFHLCERVASDRTAACRILHAVSIELTSVLITTPVIMWIADLGFWEALAVDIGLTIAYAAYAYAFHWAFDKLRPVAR